MRVIEQDVLIATRRQRLLDMLEGRIKMPLELDMRNWHCGTVACAIGNYCLLPETEGLRLINRFGRQVPEDDLPHENLMEPCARHFAISVESAYACFDGVNKPDPALIAAKFRAACGG